MKCEHEWQIVYDADHKRVNRCSKCLCNQVIRKPESKMRRQFEDKMMHFAPEVK